jgi:hypothetical protein
METVTCPTCKSDEGRWSYRTQSATDCAHCHEVKYQARLTDMGELGSLARLF